MTSDFILNARWVANKHVFGGEMKWKDELPQNGLNERLPFGWRPKQMLKGSRFEGINLEFPAL